MSINLQMNKNTYLDDFDAYLDSLNGNRMRREIAKLQRSKTITLAQLKSIYHLGVKLYSTMQLKEAGGGR